MSVCVGISSKSTSPSNYILCTLLPVANFQSFFMNNQFANIQILLENLRHKKITKNSQKVLKILKIIGFSKPQFHRL